MAPGIIWRRHVDQLRPTAVEPDIVEVNQPEVEVVGEAYHQRQSNRVHHPMWLVQFQRNPWQINQRWFLFAHLWLPSLLKRLQSVLWSVSGGTLGEHSGHHRNSISELFFVFLRDSSLLDTVSLFSLFSLRL